MNACANGNWLLEVTSFVGVGEGEHFFCRRNVAVVKNDSLLGGVALVFAVPFYPMS